MSSNQDKNSGNLFFNLSRKIESIFVIRVIRDGLITMIPILMIGAFALVFQSFPVEAYQHFIKCAAGGFIYSFFHIIYLATFGAMSFYMVLCFSVVFFTLKKPEKPVDMWGVGSALASYLIMVGIWSDSFSVSDLGATAVFLAIATSLVSCEIYFALSDNYIKIGRIYNYGADSRMGSAMGAMLPASVTIGIAVLIAYAVTLTGNATMHQLINSFFLSAFNIIDNLFIKGLCFIFVSSFLWLLGIHGSDCLQGVSDEVFQPLMDANIAAVSSGGVPQEILCKPFFDCFILMGGCGSSICLFIAIILFSRDKGMRTIAKAAGFPLLFNINELMVFGLPIVFNPMLAIPFLSVPVIQYLVAYAAMAAGLVPHITTAIEWTTPVLISGYAATGSVSGSLLQIVNIVIGVLIYAPFVKLMGRVRADRAGANREAFVKWFIREEGKLGQVEIMGLHGIYGDIAKRMALELKAGVRQEKFQLFYQPQYNYAGRCIGVEALLRWPTDEWLSVYPPLLVELAREQGILLDMEKRILSRAMSEREKIYRQFGDDIKISVNVTGSSIADQGYWDYLKSMWEKDSFAPGKLCIEVTEQDAVIFNEKIISEFRACKEMGIIFAIDDFTAGQTSMEYLKNGIFNLLKLDGSIVRVINENSRCREIISSLVALSESLHIDCLAEYVENEAIRQTLHETGCDQYQGYLYSPAVPLKED